MKDALLIALIWLIIAAPALLVGTAVAFLLLRPPFTAKRSLRQRSALSAVVGTLLTVALHFGSLDGLDGWFFSSSVFGDGFEDDSHYAIGYSEIGFRAVFPRMSASTVLALVGEPLEQYTIPARPHLTGWRWSRSPNDSSYRVRVVLFQDGRVVEKHSGFYVD